MPPDASTWFNNLPEAQQATVLAAVIAVGGVVLSAIVTLITALVNRSAAKQVRFLTNQHEHTHWRREKLWKAYAATLDSLSYYSANSISIFVIDTVEFCYLAEDCMSHLDPDYDRVLPLIYSNVPLNNLTESFDKMFEVKSNLNLKLVRLSGEHPLVSSDILVDVGTEITYSKIEDYSEQVSASFNQIFAKMDMICGMIGKIMDDSPDKSTSSDVRSRIESLYVVNATSKLLSDSIKDMRLYIVNKMQAL